LDEIRAIHGSERLANYPFYHAALGELEIGTGHFEDAREHFAVALKLARNPMERTFFEHRIGACK
jgi:RNA polymerase sigma-70 factor (ECF subfamily)